MDRDQAERSLAIIRGVIENTRDDLIERNWGVIWMVHSFINFAAAREDTFALLKKGPSFHYPSLPFPPQAAIFSSRYS